jgi:hypothetical protein
MAHDDSDALVKKIFNITMICAVLFIGTVFIFILPYTENM